jgi:hypothetical protein
MPSLRKQVKDKDIYLKDISPGETVKTKKMAKFAQEYI